MEPLNAAESKSQPLLDQLEQIDGAVTSTAFGRPRSIPHQFPLAPNKINAHAEIYPTPPHFKYPARIPRTGGSPASRAKRARGDAIERDARRDHPPSRSPRDNASRELWERTGEGQISARRRGPIQGSETHPGDGPVENKRTGRVATRGEVRAIEYRIKGTKPARPHAPCSRL